MLDKEYIVTLHKKEDLEQFYNEMQLTNFPLVLKRPLSRNTHYMMTEEQAERLRQDPRVWGVEAVDSFHFKKQVVNNEPYVIAGDFWKNAPVATTLNSNLRQWGHLHCAGDQVQKRKGNWGDGSSAEIVNDTVEIFNNGRHVDVVIVDDPVSWDSQEWFSPSNPGQTRFVQYQWFTELNTDVSSIDDDGQTLPTGTITYLDNLNTPQYHGIHVTGTAAGQYYGWANEANIYNMAITDSWVSGQSVPALLIFDYLRAFHRNKPVNPDTGIKNPTITNHSYGGIHYMPSKGTDGEGNTIYRLDFPDLVSVNFKGVIYDANSPGPSGWTEAGVETDFGVRFGVSEYPAYSSSVAADVQDAIDEGIVVIGAAGNDNLLMAAPSSVPTDDWNNYLVIFKNNENFLFYYNRGAWPNTPDSGAISVGALSDHSDFRRSTYTMFGPGVDIFAPGDLILSAYGNTGTPDAKYGGGGNYYDAISGTSMASPQVCGVIACVATGKERFSQYDAKRYLNNTSLLGDMTFDVAGGGLDDNSCRQGSPNSYLTMQNPKPVVGYSLPQISDRKTGLTYPRVATFNRLAPAPLPPTSQTYTFSVGNSGASHYVISGTDSGRTHTDANDPNINCDVGDTLVFNVNASGHPFYVKTSATTGTGNQVTTGIITGNGASVGEVRWETTGVTPGTYYYICQFHSGMVGQIIIS
jgi:plastocyanin